MKVFTLTEARKRWAEILTLVDEQKEHIFISRYGKIIAVIIPIEDAEKHLYKTEDQDL